MKNHTFYKLIVGVKGHNIDKKERKIEVDHYKDNNETTTKNKTYRNKFQISG